MYFFSTRIQCFECIMTFCPRAQCFWSVYYGCISARFVVNRFSSDKCLRPRWNNYCSRIIGRKPNLLIIKISSVPIVVVPGRCNTCNNYYTFFSCSFLLQIGLHWLYNAYVCVCVFFFFITARGIIYIL